MRAPVRAGGFTYLGLVILLAVLGMVGAATLKVGSLLQRAEREHELLEMGAAFGEALRSYAAATPPGQPQQPPTLDALLRDPRFPGVRRHLRKVFVDPVTGRAEWGLVTMGEKGGIVAVYSLSQAKPLKIGNFDARFLNFDNKEHHSDWKFTAAGQGTLAVPGGQPGAPLVPPMPPGSAPATMPATMPQTMPQTMPATAPVAEPPADTTAPPAEEPPQPAEPPAPEQGDDTPEPADPRPPPVPPPPPPRR